MSTLTQPDVSEPSLELHTPRLILRTGQPSDALAVVDYYKRNAEHLARWEPRRIEAFFTRSWWEQRLSQETREAASGRALRLWVCRNQDRTDIVGSVALSNIVRGAFHSCHLGFSIDGSLVGRGLMSEAVQRLVDYAFDDLGLHRIEANYRPENTRSAALLRRLKFVPQGFARDYLLIDGQWRDHVLTARINERWQLKRSE